MAVQARCGFYLSVAQPGTLDGRRDLSPGTRPPGAEHPAGDSGKLAKHLR
jgi:hypothetical protein